MEVVFLKAKKALSKEISKDGSKPYPLVKNFSSYSEEISTDKKGLTKLYKLLTTAADSGHCLQ